MNLNSKDNQTDKKAPQAKNKANQAKQSFKTEKSSKKAKKKDCQRQCKRFSPITTGANITPAINSKS